MEIIRQWREMHDVSQRAMAGAIGVHSSTLSQIERRHMQPSVKILCRIWRYTRLDAGALLRAAQGDDKEAGSKQRRKNNRGG